MQLRDIEVANDDYERQARNTSSSLEDLESKYNIAIERGVMMEDEVRAGEQERETLRIETQRLRDELSDLRVEADITAEKLRTAETTIERLHERKPLYLTADTVLPRSPTSEVSRTTTSSPTTSTPPPPKSEASAGSGVPTPPSPPLSDASHNPKVSARMPLLLKRRSPIPDLGDMPKPALNASTRTRASRGPSFASSTNASKHRMAPPARPIHTSSEGLPRSSSLYQIKGLIGRMQKIEERVHSVRSKLPPVNTPTPRGSPRLGSASGGAVSGSITMRNSTRKRMSSSTTSSSKLEESIRAARSSTSHVKRLSFSVPQGDLTDGSATPTSRSSSRTSSISHHTNFSQPRPSSRAGASGGRTPSALGFHSSQQPHAPASNRPRSSLGGSFGNVPRRGHAHSLSITESRESDDVTTTPLATKPTMLDRSSIPTPAALKRQSFSTSIYGRRLSVAGQHHEESLPSPTETMRKLSDVGETF